MHLCRLFHASHPHSLNHKRFILHKQLAVVICIIEVEFEFFSSLSSPEQDYFEAKKFIYSNSIMAMRRIFFAQLGRYFLSQIFGLVIYSHFSQLDRTMNFIIIIISQLGIYFTNALIRG
jgi:hypothetical protein